MHRLSPCYRDLNIATKRRKKYFIFRPNQWTSFVNEKKDETGTPKRLSKNRKLHTFIPGPHTSLGSTSEDDQGQRSNVHDSNTFHKAVINPTARWCEWIEFLIVRAVIAFILRVQLAFLGNGNKCPSKCRFWEQLDPRRKKLVGTFEDSRKAGQHSRGPAETEPGRHFGAHSSPVIRVFLF